MRACWRTCTSPSSRRCKMQQPTGSVPVWGSTPPSDRRPCVASSCESVMSQHCSILMPLPEACLLPLKLPQHMPRNAGKSFAAVLAGRYGHGTRPWASLRASARSRRGCCQLPDVCIVIVADVSRLPPIVIFTAFPKIYSPAILTERVLQTLHTC